MKKVLALSLLALSLTTGFTCSKEAPAPEAAVEAAPAAETAPAAEAAPAETEAAPEATPAAQ